MRDERRNCRLEWILGVALLGSPVIAASPSTADLLEQGIYAEETRGDLAAAIEIYKKITGAADAERPALAQALLRLGICYLKTGRRPDATAMFDKLAKQYPEQKSIVAQIPLTAQRLALLPAPWGAEETLVLRRPDFTVAQAQNNALLILRAVEDRMGDRPTTVLESDWLATRTTLRVDSETLLPIERQFDAFRRSAEKWDVTYRADTVRFVYSKDGRSIARSLPIAHTPYDSDVIFQLIRRLPLAEQYAVTIPLLARTRPEVRDATIRVLGREAITVSAGTFDTFVVRLSSAEDHMDDTFGHRSGNTTTCWYSADSTRRLVKLAEGGRSWELVEARDGRPSAKVSFRDDATGVSLDAPPGWFLIQGTSSVDQLFVHVYTPDANVLATLRLNKVPEPQPPRTPMQIATERVDQVRGQGMLRGVREGPESIEIGGVPVGRLAIDYVSVSRRTKVQYHFFFIHRGQLLTLFFYSVEPTQWESIKPVLDEIARSVRLQ